MQVPSLARPIPRHCAVYSVRSCHYDVNKARTGMRLWHTPETSWSLARAASDHIETGSVHIVDDGSMHNCNPGENEHDHFKMRPRISAEAWLVSWKRVVEARGFLLLARIRDLGPTVRGNWVSVLWVVCKLLVYSLYLHSLPPVALSDTQAAALTEVRRLTQ